jgi:ubiquinol-cytochrome c reductase iron-sulfur subunit
VGRARDFLISSLVLLAGRSRRKPGEAAARILPKLPPSPRAETAAIGLLFVGALFAVAFVVVYAVDAIPAQTQLLGVTLGLAFVCIAAALIVVALELIVTEELVEPYPPREHPHEQEVVGRLVEESGDRLTRRGLFKLGIGAAGGAVGLAAITPALSFGPLLRTKLLYVTPWRRGRLLVDEHGRPIKAADIEEKSFYTAFPQGADKEDPAAPLVVIRLPEGALRLPQELAGYAADGIVAYSKICTHAGCAVAMYRAPLFAPDEPRPALVCPCHYSTFDPAHGGSVTFGPAGRRLPMLPIAVDPKGFLRAKGTFNDRIGPSWWGVRSGRPSS